MCFTIGLIYYQINSVKTYTVSTITNKLIDGNRTYLTVDNIKLKCTKNEYYLINVNEEYVIDYRWNRFNPNVGKLLDINQTSSNNKNK